MFQIPPGLLPELTAVLQQIRADWMRREVAILGWRHDGTSLHLRFKPAISVQWVHLHVQNVANGGAAYDPAAYVVSEEIDCREARVQDYSTPDVLDERVWVWLIPVEKDAAGTAVKYDGRDGRPDVMSFLDFGV